MEQWYTLHTKPNKEYQVETALREQAFETCLPELAPSPGHSAEKPRPFFPCYLFVKVDFEAVELSRVQWLPGLRRIVAFDGLPVAVPEEVIRAIRQKLRPGAGAPGHGFQPGEAVRITAGPFRDMLAVFDGPTTPARRVQVLLNILGQTNRVQLSAAALEKTSPPRPPELSKRPRRTRGGGRRINYQTHPAPL